MVNDDACSNACKTAKCGDGVKQMGEECDDANMVNDDACSNMCKTAKCGDAIKQAGEDCDDGNMNNGDGCSATCKSEGSCLNNPKWMPVNCSTPKWVWSSNRNIATTLAAANANKVLWAGCTHAPAGNTCSLDGTGWVSTATVAMAGCNASWYHIGGEFSGNCGGHDGDVVRRLVLGKNDCYDY